MADTIKQKILFQMGTTGTGAATKSIGSMAAKLAVAGVAIAGVVKGFSKMYDAAVTLDRQLQALTIDMSTYNAETKGLIDTNDGLAAAIQLQNAGIKTTAAEMSAMGKAAIDMNQKLGGKAGGSTEIFNGLVKSIVNARETGLVKFGIELSQTGDKAAASKEALGALVEKFGDVTVEAETAKEKMYAFNNSFDTIKASEFNGILTNLNSLLADSVTAITGSSTAMSDYEQDILDTNGAISEYMWSLEGMILRNGMWINSLNNNTEHVKKLNEQYQAQVDFLTNIARLERSIAGKKADLAGRESIDDLRNKFINAKDPRSAGIYGKQLQSKISGKAREDMNNKERAVFDSGLLDVDFSSGAKKTTTKSGGGSRRAERYDAVFTEDDINAHTINQLGGAARIRTDDFSGGGEFQLGNALGLGAAGAGAGAAQSSQGRMNRNNQALLAQQQEAAALKIELERSTFETMLGLERQYMQESARMSEMTNRQRADSVETMAGSVSSSMSNLSKSMNTESKKGFEAMKAMSYASNAVETILGSTAAFRSVMQTVPYPANLILAPIAAGTVGAMGAANGRKIRSQKFGGGSTPTPSTGGSTSFPSGGSLAGTGSSEPDNYTINVNVDGNTIHQSLMTANDFANQSGSKHFTTEE